MPLRLFLLTLVQFSVNFNRKLLEHRANILLSKIRLKKELKNLQFLFNVIKYYVTNNKILYIAYYVYENKLDETKISLYRVHAVEGRGNPGRRLGDLTQT